MTLGSEWTNCTEEDIKPGEEVLTLLGHQHYSEKGCSFPSNQDRRLPTSVRIIHMLSLLPACPHALINGTTD